MIKTLCLILYKLTFNINIKSYSKKLSVLIQTIKALGRDNIKETDIIKLATYSKDIKEDLSKASLRLPFWIKEVLDKIQRYRNDEK